MLKMFHCSGHLKSNIYHNAFKLKIYSLASRDYLNILHLKLTVFFKSCFEIVKRKLLPSKLNKK